MILLYTDGSKKDDGTMSSAWQIVKGPKDTILFDRHCQTGKNADIEDTEIPAIQEGLHQLAKGNTSNVDIVQCVENSNPLLALECGPTEGCEYVQAILEDMKVLQQQGCMMRGK